jgi:hypothetical protein
MRAPDDEIGSIFIPGFTFLGRKLSVYIILCLKLLDKYYAARSSSQGFVSGMIRNIFARSKMKKKVHTKMSTKLKSCKQFTTKKIVLQV